MPLNRLMQEKREEILRIAAQHGVSTIRVFGSAARGEAREGSDLDLLIEAEPQRTPRFPGGLIADLEELMSCRVDVVTEKALH